MFIVFLMIISILSLFTWISKKIEEFIVKNFVYLRWSLLWLSILSLWFLFDTHTIKLTGNIALEILWVLLFLPILAYVFSFGIAKKLMPLRKEWGILMGALGIIHSIQYFMGRGALSDIFTSNFWISGNHIGYLWAGMIATLILIILTITSNNWAIKTLGKYWKPLHRVVYICIIFTVLHVVYMKSGRMRWWVEQIHWGELAILWIYFIGKIAEWRWISIKKKESPQES